MGKKKDMLKKNDVRRNIVKALVFMIILVFMFVEVSYALRPSNHSTLRIQTYRKQPKDTIDVVYFGPSSVFAYWAPMDAYAQQGFTSFNFSYHGGMPPEIIKSCIIEALKTQSPELIILDMRNFEWDPGNLEAIDYNDDVFRYYSDSFRYSLNRAHMIETIVPKENGRLNYHFDIAKYHTNIGSLKIKDNWKYAFDVLEDDAKNFGGYYYLNVYSEIERSDNSGIKDLWALSPVINDIYLDIMDYCKSINTDLLLIVPPYAETANHRKRHNYLKKTAEDNGVAFLNCNDVFDEIGLDVQTDFTNNNHVSIFGARKYTAWLGHYLKNEYNLPDRRSDNNYVNWNKAYDSWMLAVSDIEQEAFDLLPADLRAKVK